jgi:hypothetical protein
MSRLLVVTDADESPGYCLAATAYMMEAVSKGRTQGAPMLRIARPRGESLVLGRFQRARTALNLEACQERGLEVLRRLTGGSTAWLGAGRLYVALALPDRTEPLDCEPRQFLQRYGAGLVRGLVALGTKARYFGKDLLSIEDRPVGIMSFELAADGSALLEAVIGLDQPWRPEAALSGYPPRTKEESSATPTLLADELEGLDPAALAEPLAEAMAGLLEAEPQEHRFNPLESERIKSLSHRVEVTEPVEEKRPAYLKPWDSRPVEEAIGFVETSVRLSQGRFLRDVSIHGDFMADSAGVAELEQRLKMVPIKRRPVALVIDDVLGAPDHVIMGIRRLGSVLEAILDASKRASEEGQTGKKET